jgi:serine carboxypeptidase-like clade 2
MSGQPISEFFNKPSVRKSLNIPEKASQIWDFCSSSISSMYERDLKRGSLWIYKQLRNKYRMLKFSGDADAVVPALGSMRWISELGWKVVRKWRPYMSEGEVIGYIEERDGLTFATIRHAGHAVP